MSGDHKHHHAFVAPEELAKKWNTPERDQWQRPEEIISALALRPGARVADLGAGTGYMVAHLSKVVGQDGTVIAVDSEAAMIEYLTRRTAELGPATVVPHKVGPDDPKLEPGSLDGVLTLDTWHHVDGREAYARKVFDSLKTGGRFVIVDHDVDASVGPPQAMRIDPGRLSKELEASGFRVEVVKESMPRHYMVVGHKD